MVQDHATWYRACSGYGHPENPKGRHLAWVRGSFLAEVPQAESHGQRREHNSSSDPLVIVVHTTEEVSMGPGHSPKHQW